MIYFINIARSAVCGKDFAIANITGNTCAIVLTSIVLILSRGLESRKLILHPVCLFTSARENVFGRATKTETGKHLSDLCIMQTVLSACHRICIHSRSSVWRIRYTGKPYFIRLRQSLYYTDAVSDASASSYSSSV